MAKTPNQTGFQARNTPAERRAFFDQLRQLEALRESIPADTITQDEADARYVNEADFNAQGDARWVNVTGDTMTGGLNMNGQTITNLPNPTGGLQPVPLDYADARYALDSTVDRLFSDTGWQAITPDPNWTGGISIRRQGGAVSLVFAPQRSVAGGPSDMSPFNVPAAYRATITIRGVAWVTSPSAQVRFTIGTDGTFTIFAATFNAGGFLQGQANWLINIP